MIPTLQDEVYDAIQYAGIRFNYFLFVILSPLQDESETPLTRFQS